MNRFIKNKKALIATLVMVCVAAIGITGMTIALYSDVSTVKENTFTVGNVTTDIEENIVASEGIKEPTVRNTGKNACIIRMRMTLSPQSAESNVGVSGGSKDVLWIYNEKDGFYYYNAVVQPGESTQALFSKYEIKDPAKFEPFDMTLYQEAVQAEAVNDAGDVISALDKNGNFNVESANKIWKIYSAE